MNGFPIEMNHIHWAYSHAHGHTLLGFFFCEAFKPNHHCLDIPRFPETFILHTFMTHDNYDEEISLAYALSRSLDMFHYN
eukprot:scaffold6749_cov162-Amphora_coffeaeformis.AAC.7